MAGRFSGVSKLSMMGNSLDFFPIGTHIVEIEAVSIFQANDNQDLCHKTTGKILETDNPDIVLGSSAVQVLRKKGGFKDTYFFQDIKRISACLATEDMRREGDFTDGSQAVDDSFRPPDVAVGDSEALEIWWDNLIELVAADEGSAVKGYRLALTAYNVKNKKSAGERTQNDWAPLPFDSPWRAAG